MDMNKIVIASRNKGKIKEIKSILSELPLLVKSIDDFKGLPEVKEDGDTFKQNAVKKAKTIMEILDLPVLADDSGLEVDYIGGLPGVRSARFAGENATDEQNNKKLLKLLEGVSFNERTARFVCVMALALPQGSIFTTTGSCEGYIATEPKGKHGFGYDPLFFIPEYNATMAELGDDLKNRISHRAKALSKMKQKIIDVFQMER
ncbi:MAG: XTP/dITP diphosphohydrolase [Thermosediminibacterales bacterium]|nr:XTP/dITP diphosphohydrolase [Thermosediminibacterales bacterium]MDK2835724.1 XTP/dITP diphosphohydrolase [Thermosediminibacterales bacterium]